MESIKKKIDKYYIKFEEIPDKKDKRKKNYKIGKLHNPDGKPLVTESWKSLDKRKQLAKSIDLLVISALVKNNNELDGKTYTIGRWMKEIGFMSEEEYNDSRTVKYGNKYYNENEPTVKEIQGIIKKLEEEKVIEENVNYTENAYMLQDYFTTTNLAQAFKESLARLERTRIIVSGEFIKAKLRGSETFITLDEIVFSTIVSGEQKIKEDLERKGKSINGSEFNKLKDKFYENIEYIDSKGDKQSISIDFYFRATMIQTKTTKSRTFKYIERNGKEILEQYKKDRENLWQNEIALLKAEKFERMNNELHRQKDNYIDWTQKKYEKDRDNVNKVGTMKYSKEDCDFDIGKIEKYRSMYVTAFKRLEEYYTKDMFYGSLLN